MIQTTNGLQVRYTPTSSQQQWYGPANAVAFDEAGIAARLGALDRPCYVVWDGTQVGVADDGQVHASNGSAGQCALLAYAPPVSPQQFGDPLFRAAHRVRYAYSTGAMANGIASEELVIAMGQAGLLGSFGAAGLVPTRVEAAIQRIQDALPNGPYAFNLIHSPSEEALERGAVDLYLRHGVRVVEASAFMGLTPWVVRYRAAGLRLNSQNQIEIDNRLIAKVSRREVARQFMEPAPPRLLSQLVQAGLLSEQQANLAQYVPMADDITAEADSGGHTDNRPLVCLLPALLSLRDEIQQQQGYGVPVRVGAAGGIGTPDAALAAFAMGAAYIVTGSVNQGCHEAGASEHTRTLLAQADIADVMMAPAADMFEMGVQVQVLKQGTLFGPRAQKLYELYQAHDSLEAIPAAERTRLERQFFHKSLDAIWQETESYFQERDPEQIARAHDKPKRKMALVFRWYLGLSSRWSNTGTPGRELDYQVWCGPSMGAFNEWVRGSYLEDAAQRSAPDVAAHIMHGVAYLHRTQQIQLQGVGLPAALRSYRPAPRP